MIATKPDKGILRQFTILYVEDEKDIQEQLSRFLRRRCGQLFLASDGAEGIRQFARHKPDIVITDIRMPRKNGIEMALEIKEQNPDTPIIVTTAHNDAEYLVRCIEAGVDRYVFKPTNMDELMEALHKNAGVLVRRLEARECELEQARVTEIELRRLRQEAEAANKAKSELLTNVSHELRTPLGAMLGFTRLVIDENPDDEALNSKLGVAVRNGEYLLRLINNLLDLSEIEAAKYKVRMNRFSPAAMLGELRALMLSSAKAEGVKLSVAMPGELPEEMESDPQMLRRILTNLVGNAVKFTEQGEIEIKAIMETREEGEYIRYSVRDTGIGIEPDALRGLFRPFVQGDATIRRRYGGTGLGLAISKQLAELLGGSLRAESEVGSGSCFSLSVPAVNPGNRRRYDAGDLDGLLAGGERRDWDAIRLNSKILIVEDNIDNRLLLSTILRRHGADIVLAEDGESAVNQALHAWHGEHPYDIVLMDMQMPIMDGYSATRRLREAGYPGTIVALTAQAMKNDRAKCLAAGCDEYITKPLNRGRLLELVAGFSAGKTLPEEYPPAL